MDESTHRSRSIVWLAGGALLLLLLGCLLATALGVLFLLPARSTTASPRPAAQEQVWVVPVEPTPPPLILPPADGEVDYASATLAAIYREVNPSVVNVTVLGDPHDLPAAMLPDDWDPEALVAISTGSGFVWDTQGHIVTNNHVVEGAELLQLTFSDGAAAVAEVVGTDADSDLAVLRIDPQGYTLVPIRRGSMEDVYVGMRVAAIGNPFGLEGTLTSGIVSAIGRSIPARQNFSIPDSIQTDAPINPGNSGGPLLNDGGELIGVNAQIRSEERANSGVGFAIPISIVERVVPALIETGAYEHSYIGVSGWTLSPVCADETGFPPEQRGALVVQTLPGTPAAKAGLRGGEEAGRTLYPGICPERVGGDIIVAIDGQPVRRFDDVLVYLERYTSPGDTVALSLLRDGSLATVEVVLGERP